MSEHKSQRALFAWRDLHLSAYPELAAMFAIPNGGKRNRITGALMKAEGVQPGVLDVFLLAERENYRGLVIEMKHGKNVLSDEQRAWVRALSALGFLVVVCYSAVEAIDRVEKYLKLRGGRKDAETTAALLNLREVLDRKRLERELQRKYGRAA